jgi:Zn-finger nucleic acid-binding protein
MNTCPQCNGELEQSKTEFGAMFGCKKCGGLMATMTVLRRVIRHETINEIWQSALRADASAGDGPAGRPCPVCRKPMVQVVATPAPDAPTLDVCTPCQAIWFDAAEFNRVPLAPPPEPDKADKPLDPRTREAMGMFNLRNVIEKQEWQEMADRPQSNFMASIQDNWWQALWRMFLGR